MIGLTNVKFANVTTEGHGERPWSMLPPEAIMMPVTHAVARNHIDIQDLCYFLQ